MDDYALPEGEGTLRRIRRRVVRLRELERSLAAGVLAYRPWKAVVLRVVELGELCRVHRGAVTGRNRVWVTYGDDLPELLLQ